MKKTLLATAIAGVMAATSAQAATIVKSETTKMDLYGNVQLVYSSTDPEVGESKSELADNGSTLGVKGEHSFGNGLTGFFKAEFEFDADEQKDNESKNGLEDGDQAYIGVKGAFGKVQVGSFDTIYNNAIQDGVDPSEVEGPSGAMNTREGDTIAYFSPSFNGLQVQLAAQVKGDGEDFGSADERATEDGTAVEAVVKYEMGGMYVAAGYDNNENRDKENTYGLAAGYTMGALGLNAKFERHEAPNGADDTDYMALGAMYNYGAGSMYGTFQQVDQGNTDFNEILLGANYNLGENFYVYVEYFDQEDDHDTTSLGAVYSF